jgi:phenylpropionate dioxygenase-like ring-hydroxylating dioxygenase large terminal subunit
MIELQRHSPAGAGGPGKSGARVRQRNDFNEESPVSQGPIDPAETRVDAKTSSLAGRDTPLLRNQWYVAAMADEVTRTPLRRTILEQDIVLYRKENGQAVALQNRCAHRSYPLSQGELNGDRIVCGYHGFQYGPDGRCAHVPALDKAVPGIRVQAYPLIELGPFLWIWPGDEATADPAKLPDQSWYREPGWKSVHGYIYMKANYLGLHENLMDLSHFAFLHTFAKGAVHLARERPKFQETDDRVGYSLVMPNIPVSPTVQAIMGFQAPITEATHNTVTSPAMHVGQTTQTDSSSPPKVLRREIVHIMTPETQTTTHYYWAIVRDKGLDNAELDSELHAFGHMTFDEDRVALEEIEQIYATDNRPDFQERIIISDSGGVRLLRLFGRMAAKEQQIAKQAAE